AGSIAGQEPESRSAAASDAHPQALAQALRAYFAAPDANGPELATVRTLTAGHDAEVVAMLRQKTFLEPRPAIARRGTIDRNYRFVDDAEAPNPALFYGPASSAQLPPLVVYVPDTTDSAHFVSQVKREGAERGYFVLLVPDERRDNLWRPCEHETRRHTAPLRDLLLQHAIDPDRIYFVGSGRGGHAAWDIGLMRSELWAAIYPCNGGLIHEGGFQTTGGVFVENAKDLSIFTVFNTSFDHGIESCRLAARLCKQWNCRFESTEEPAMRVMRLVEATPKLASVARAAHPRTITKRFNRLADGSHCWLQALDRKPKEWDPTAKITVRGTWPQERAEQLQAIWNQVQQECARLHGIIAGNSVRIESQGVGRLRIWLDSELLDFAAKVSITVNGRSRPAVQPSRKLDVMLQRVHATGDTERLYWDFVDVSVPK
ncbi:MAG: hypothetical protein ABIP94_17810, partial [Planctomycetota bacterium]